MSRVDVVDPALERVQLDLFNALSVVCLRELTHLLFGNLWKSLEINEIWGGEGVKMPQKFLTI